MNDTFTVGGKTVVPFTKPTITAGAYSANDAVGGVMTFPVGNGPRRSGIITGLTITDVSSPNAAIALNLFLFSHNITGLADNAAFAPTSAELHRCIGVISVGTSDYAAAGATGSVAHLSGLAIPFVCPWGALGIANVSASGSLIQVTTLVAHGLATGAVVSISGVQGVTAANKSDWTITATSSTAFTLNGSTHSGTYVLGTGDVRIAPEERNYSIYGQLMTTGTPTYSGVADLSVKLHVLQD